MNSIKKQLEKVGARISGAREAYTNAEHEEKALEEMERQEGTEFPGSDYRSDNHKEWMSTLDLGAVKLSDVCWPGTHDSATDKIGVACVSRPFAQCQEDSIYEQLSKGVRVLDIRVQNEGRVCHGILTSYKVDDVLNDLKRFVSETSCEIVILDIRTEFGNDDPPGFAGFLSEQLGELLVAQDVSVFHKTLKEVLPKRVICVWRPRKDPAPAPGSPLFSSAFIKDNWTDTDLPLTKFQANMKHLGEHPNNRDRNYFYRVENTCTPQVASGILVVKTVTNRIHRFARLFISQAFKKGLGDKLQILSEDYVDADFVDACIGVTVSRQQQHQAQ